MNLDKECRIPYYQKTYASTGYSVLPQDDVYLSSSVEAFHSKGVSVKKSVVLMLLGSMAFGQLLQPPTTDTLHWLLWENNQIQLKLKDAGNKLSNARWGFYAGIVLNVAGTILILSAEDEHDGKIPFGIGINVIGFLIYCWAWSDIGYAGDRLRD